MDDSRHSILMSYLIGLNTECMLEAWEELTFAEKKKIWPEIPSNIQRVIYTNVNDYSLYELRYFVMSNEELKEMEESINNS